MSGSEMSGPRPAYAVTRKSNIPIPMRDGVHLLADHYAPRDAGPAPTIFIRSYWGRTWREAPFSLLYMYIARKFARAGYHVLLQDVHARLSGPGEHPMPHAWEVSDGADTLDWLAGQKWFDGRLGLWGASYLGYTAWAAAAQQSSPHTGIRMLSLLPAATATNWRPVFHENGAFALDTALRLQYILSVLGKPFPQFVAHMLSQETAIRKAAAHLPVVDAGECLPPVNGFDLRAMLRADAADAPFWEQIDLSRTASQPDLSVHLVAGWFDVFLKAQLEDYARLCRAGAHPYLTIGPWHHTHNGLGTASIQTGLDWFDATLKGKQEGLRDAPVRVWLIGEGRWLEMEYWPPETHEERLYLSSEGGLNDKNVEGDAPPAAFRYDPADPTPSTGGAVINSRAGLRDQSAIEKRLDVLVYTGQVLENDLVVVGAPAVKLYAAGSLSGWDLVARLCDVDAQGRSSNVCEGILRCSTPPGEVQEVFIELWPTAYCFKAGHRLRLHVAGGAHPRWGRNPGAEGSIPDAVQTRACEVSLYHDAARPSRLTLPVMP